MNEEIDSLYNQYKEKFNEDFDLFGLYWNDPQKNFDILLECIEKNKPFSEVLSDEELNLIEEAKKGNIVF